MRNGKILDAEMGGDLVVQDAVGDRGGDAERHDLHELHGPLSAAFYFGAMRSAPSRRMTSPLIMALSTMWSTRAAYSSGLPNRVGNGTLWARLSCTGCGMPRSSGVAKRPGAMALTRTPLRANSR